MYPFPFCAVFTVAAAEGIRELLQPQADFFKTLELPEALVHWGHPGNMMVVLLAMGGYGALYKGWQIRTSNDMVGNREGWGGMGGRGAISQMSHDTSTAWLEMVDGLGYQTVSPSLMPHQDVRAEAQDMHPKVGGVSAVSWCSLDSNAASHQLGSH